MNIPTTCYYRFSEYMNIRRLDLWSIRTQQNKSGLQIYDETRMQVDNEIPITVTTF